MQFIPILYATVQTPVDNSQYVNDSSEPGRGSVVDQSEWIAHRNMRNYSALMRGSDDNDLKRTVNRLLREEKKKFATETIGFFESGITD